MALEITDSANFEFNLVEGRGNLKVPGRFTANMLDIIFMLGLTPISIWGAFQGTATILNASDNLAASHRIALCGGFLVTVAVGVGSLVYLWFKKRM